MIRKIIYLFILGIIIQSCKKEKEFEPFPINCWVTNTIPNADSSACICPNETHFTVDNNISEHPDCRLKSEYSYYVEIDSSICVNTFGKIGIDTVVGEKGWAEFDTIKGNFSTNWNGSGYLNPDLYFSNPKKYIMNIDGSFELEYHVYSGDIWQCPCLDYGDCKVPKFRGVAKGKSNKDHSEILFEVIYYDCHGVPVDTGRVSMWREW